ncbi:hypothetical protein ACWGKW_41365 [Streptomyces sp. NPDC054766]
MSTITGKPPDSEVGGHLLDRHPRATVPRDSHDVLAEVASDWQPGQPAPLAEILERYFPPELPDPDRTTG